MIRGWLLGAWVALVVPVLAQDPPAALPPAPEPTDLEVQEESERLRGRLEIDLSPATKGSARAFDLPYATLAPDPEELRRARIVQDVLRKSPGVVIQRTSYGQASPFLRNLTGYHTLLLVDGFRLNTSTLRSGPNEYWGLVDGMSVDHLETVLGPSSVLWGSDAVGGVTNAITRRQDPVAEDFWIRRVAARFSSAENSLVARGEVSGSVGNGLLGFLVGGGGGSFGDLDGGGDTGTQDHTGYSQQFGDAHFVLRLDDHWSARLLVQAGWLNDIGRVHRTPFGTPYHGTTVGNERRHNLSFERELLGFTLVGRALDAFADEITLRLGYQNLEEDLDRVRNDFRRDKSGFDVGSYSLGVDFGSNTGIGRLSYGLDYAHDEVDSFRKNFNAAGALTSIGIQGPVGDEAQYDLLGVYLQDEIALGEDWTAILGLRFTAARAGAREVEGPAAPGVRSDLEDSWANLVGSGRLLWRACESLRVYGGVSQGFRAPNLSDLTRFDIARSSELEVPAPGLDSEDFISFELGAHYECEALRADVALYHLLIDDLIIRAPTGMMSGTDVIVTKKNSGDGHLQGLEASFAWDFAPQWTLSGGFAWTDGQIDAFATSAPVLTEEVFTRLAPIQGRVGLRWTTADGAFYIEPNVLMVASQDRLSSSDRRDTQRVPPGGSPGYTIYGVNLGYRFDAKSEAFLSIENITDKDYRVHGSGVQEAGINLIAGFDWTF